MRASISAVDMADIEALDHVDDVFADVGCVVADAFDGLGDRRVEQRVMVLGLPSCR